MQVFQKSRVDAYVAKYALKLLSLESRNFRLFLSHGPSCR